MIKRRLEIVKERSGMYNYQGWYVEEYQNNSKKLYICTKELEHGTVCVVTNNLENLKDVEIFSQ
ncbi:hypothetical protein KKP90_04695 [Methanothermococcus sp. SCGC AD-155-E23]|nr:hypothetical protein [Methanothermococcus sp. SCGC AD-155-E23]